MIPGVNGVNLGRLSFSQKTKAIHGSSSNGLKLLPGIGRITTQLSTAVEQRVT
jgi:hypothetical protein